LWVRKYGHIYHVAYPYDLIASANSDIIDKLKLLVIWILEDLMKLKQRNFDRNRCQCQYYQ